MAKKQDFLKIGKDFHFAVGHSGIIILHDEASTVLLRCKTDKKELYCSARAQFYLLYGEELAAEVAGDFKDNRAIFQYYKLPNCPDCDKCRLVDECRNRQIQTIKRTITEIELKNNIRQINLKEALSNDEE